MFDEALKAQKVSAPVLLKSALKAAAQRKISFSTAPVLLQKKVCDNFQLARKLLTTTLDFAAKHGTAEEICAFYRRLYTLGAEAIDENPAPPGAGGGAAAEKPGEPPHGSRAERLQPVCPSGRRARRVLPRGRHAADASTAGAAGG
ncbi:MAG: hypothetical protein L6W00_02535 [Lentisphaeria bacterium]|nr:MAG: hypothetical protein L6W00_02535 [Lentisphaeria bacterium]